MSIVARFKINNKEYVYYQNNKQLKYGYIDGDFICDELNEDEISLMNNLFQKITISKDKSNHIKISIIKYHQKNYQVIFDIISELKYVLEITPYGLKEPVYNEVRDILHFLNDGNTYSKINLKLVEFEDADEKVNQVSKEIMIKRKIGKTIFTIYISAFLAFSTFAATFVITNVFNPLEARSPIFSMFNGSYSFEKNFTKEIISYEEIVVALSKNDSLPQKYKDRILANASAITENYELISKNKVLERIETLKVIDAVGLQIEDGVNANILGTYNIETNIIKIYEENRDYQIIDHELFHLMGYGTISLGDALYEGTNEIFRTEYSSKMNDNYSYFEERNIVKLLIEIIGTEPFRTLQFKCDPYDIIKELTNIIDDDKMAIETVCLVDNLSRMRSKITLVDQSSLESQELLENIDNIKLQIITNISKYYAAKYKEDINNDLVCSIYINGISPEPKTLFVEGTDIPVEFVEKAYFREDMVKEMQDGIYRFNNKLLYEYDYKRLSIEEAIESGILTIETDDQGANYYVADRENVFISDNIVMYEVPKLEGEPQNPIKITDENRYLNQYSKMLG